MRISVFLFLSVIVGVESKEEYVPAIFWTSRHFQGRKNVDYLVLKKINSDMFKSFILELLGGEKPTVVVFLEQILDTDDFEWRDSKGDNSFPFLSNQTVNSRVDYFRSVESPHQTILQLCSRGFKQKVLKPGTKFGDVNAGELLIVEFQAISSQRPETLKSHDQVMEEVHKKLVRSGKSWLCVYTARYTDNRGYFLGLKQLSPWIVEEQVQEKPTKALSLYRDDSTGFTLITKGSLQLLLPSPKNLVSKFLENYLGASAKPSKGGIDFVIRFSNYTLTLHLSRSTEDWVIDGAKLLNGNGDVLKLTQKKEDTLPTNKCFFQLNEFESEGKPLVKVALSKYKFTKLEMGEESCKKPYGFHVTFSVIFISIISAVICWNKVLENLNFSTKSNIVRISTKSLLSLEDSSPDSPNFQAYKVILGALGYFKLLHAMIPQFRLWTAKVDSVPKFQNPIPGNTMENLPIYPPAPIPPNTLLSGSESMTFIHPGAKRQCTWQPGADKQLAPHTFGCRFEKHKIYPSVLHAVGNTPLIRLNVIPKSYGIKCEMLAKCEFLNPGGSVKDRIAVNMIQNAEKKGLLKPGDRVIEPTAGNTGLGLAMAATIKGYKCTCVIPMRMSNDKVHALKALGADVVRTPKAEIGTKDCPFYTSQRISKELPNSIILDQFRNAYNPLVHYETTAEEILYQCDGKVDAIVCGSGTGGTMTGIGRKMKEKCPSCRMIGADPIGSKMAEPEELNEENANFEMEGIGFPFVPTTLDRSVVSEWYKVSDKESMLMARRMVTEEGILCGGSSGTAMCAAVKAAQKMKEGERLVVILPDGMRNYMTKFVSDPWMKTRDFIGIDDGNRWWWSFVPVKELDLRKPNVIPSTTSCGAALQKMSSMNQDQIFIEKEGTILGVITSTKMLDNLMELKCGFEDPVEKVVEAVRTVDEETPLGKICALIQVESFVLVETSKPSFSDTNQGQSSGEKNLKYVAVSDLLKFITSKN